MAQGTDDLILVIWITIWIQGPISQRDLSPDLDLNLRLWSCQKNVKSVVLDLADFTKQLSP